MQFRRPRLPFLYLLRREKLFESGNLFADFFVSICFRQETPSVGFNEILRHASPLAYIRPRLNCAMACPCSAALRYHFTAST